jgi:polyferredoxin
MKKNKTRQVRLAVQIGVFALVFAISISKWLSERGIAVPFLPDASLHAVCPFGGVATIYQFISTGGFIQKIHSSAFILMLLGLLAAVLFGAIFCGYLCPFGSFQEWIGKLGKKLFPRKFNRVVPAALDRVLRYLRYVVLVLVLYQTAATAKLVFESIDPYYALFNFFSNQVAISAYIMLGCVAALSLMIERLWCKYFCPYGALLGLFNKVRLFKIRRNPNSCIGCQKCNQVCPMNVAVSSQEVINSHQCIACYKCTSDDSCPIPNTATISVKKEEIRHEA